MALVTINTTKSLLPPESFVVFTGSNIAPKTISSAGYTVLLDGSGSNDPDGTIISYQWERKKNSEQWVLQKSTTISNFSQFLKVTGNYTYRLKCVDNEGLESYSN
jgi:hypothetical protein